MSEWVQVFLGTPLGKQFNASEAAELVAACAPKNVARGAALFRSGDAGYTLFIVLQGGFDVVLGHVGGAQTTVANVGPGQIVGELELMTQSARVASLLANDEAVLLELSGTRFDAMLSENRAAANKLLHTLAKTLARRLAAVNQRILAKIPAPLSPAVSAQASAPPPLPTLKVSDADLDVLDKLWG